MSNIDLKQLSDIADQFNTAAKVSMDIKLVLPKNEGDFITCHADGFEDDVVLRLRKLQANVALSRFEEPEEYFEILTLRLANAFADAISKARGEDAVRALIPAEAKNPETAAAFEAFGAHSFAALCK